MPLPQVLNAAGTPQNSSTVYTFDGQDWPLVVYRLTAGTAALHIDLVQAMSAATVVGQPKPVAKTVGELAFYAYQSRNSNGDAENNGYNTFAVSTL